MAMKNIKEYIATLGDEGPAYANRFEVVINPSQSGRMSGKGLPDKCALFCEEVQIPGAILSNKEFNIGPWTFFRNTKLGFLGNEINFTFMTTNEWQLRGEFEGWISDCVNANSQEVAYLDDISCTVDIFCLNPQDEVTKKWTLYEAMPKVLNLIPLSHGTVAPIRNTLIMSAAYWESSDAGGIAGLKSIASGGGSYNN